jgi:nucleoside-triphosphatase
MLTAEIRKCGYRVGFSVIDIATGRNGVLAQLHRGKGPKIGRYTVNLRDLEEVGVAAIRHAVLKKDLIVIDEIAPMELCSPVFIEAVEKVLTSSRHLLISTHAHTNHPLVHRVRQELELFRVKRSNRDNMVETIVEAFKSGSDHAHT